MSFGGYFPASLCISDVKMVRADCWDWKTTTSCCCSTGKGISEATSTLCSVMSLKYYFFIAMTSDTAFEESLAKPDPLIISSTNPSFVLAPSKAVMLSSVQTRIYFK